MHPLAASYAAKPWAMEAAALERFVATVAALPTDARPSQGEPAGATPYAVRDGVAMIPVVGPLLKSVPPILRMFGIEATGYDELRVAIVAANDDPTVSRIALVIDSPGGEVDGVHGVVDAVYLSRKPVAAHVDVIAASAAYWIASQARQIETGRAAYIGSIGIYTVAIDASQAAAAAGVRVHVIASGPHKGAGTPGAPVTPEHLAEMQRQVEECAGVFVADVARGRGASVADIHAHADGRLFSAADAKARGLVDHVADSAVEERRTMDALKLAADLSNEHAAHAQLIVTMAAACKPEAEIRAAIASAERAKLNASHEAGPGSAASAGNVVRAGDGNNKPRRTLAEFESLSLAGRTAFLKGGGVLVD